MDHNPQLKAARKRMYDNYEASEKKTDFKSRRPKSSSEYIDPDVRMGDYHQEKFLNKYRWSHLHSSSNVPMSYRNIDRHGLGNLKIEAAKPLDRTGVPPYALWGMIFFGAVFLR